MEGLCTVTTFGVSYSIMLLKIVDRAWSGILKIRLETRLIYNDVKTISCYCFFIFTSIFWQKLNLGKKKFDQIFFGPKTFLVKIFGSEIFWAKKI